MSLKNVFAGLLTLAAGSAPLSAQIVPAPNSLVNSTQLYFEEIVRPGAALYELVLHTDSMRDPKVPLLINKRNSVPAFSVSNLEWGQSYIWSIKMYDKNNTLMYQGERHPFSIASLTPCFLNGVEIAKLNIVTNNESKHAGGYLMIDHMRAIVDRSGKPVWTLPDIKNVVDNTSVIRDLKITADNTITFLVTEGDAVEIDMSANVLWKAPRPFVFEKDTVLYHHDLKKTKRGTYLVLGNRKVKRRLLGTYTAKQLEREYDVTVVDGKTYRSTQMNVILEFDKDGKLIWFWDTNTYLTDEDLAFKKHSEEGGHVFSSHSNAFSESEDGTKIYIGFRDLSRIVVVDKKTKKVVMSYGEKYPSGDGKGANELFRKQHSANITKRKSLLIFNNNIPPAASGIVEFREAATAKDTALWSFYLGYDKLTNVSSPGGGNVSELPNSNILLCAGSLNRIIEVTRNKEIVWDAIVLGRPRKNENWVPFPQYRASWIPELKQYSFIPLPGVARARGEVNLTITNTGNAEDTYEIEVLAGTKSVYKKSTAAIKANESSVQDLKLKDIPAGVTRLIIKISSEKGKTIKRFEQAL